MAGKKTATMALVCGLAVLALLSGAQAATLTPTTTFSASDTVADDLFGQCVSVFSDYLIVGAESDDDAGVGAGAVYFFKHNGVSFVEKNKIAAPAGGGSDFGQSCQLDGDFGIVGANFAGTGGQAYIVQTTDAGETWSVVQTLVASDTANADRFGIASSISGNYAVVGASHADPAATSAAGKAYVYVTSNSWSSTTEVILTASDGAQDNNFGRTVSVSGDMVAVGAYNAVGARGKAYVFTTTDSGSTWVQRQILTATTPTADDEFGFYVSLDSTANRLAVGAPGRSSDLGAIMVFETSDAGVTWTETDELTSSAANAGGKFGYTTHVDGDRIVGGAPFSLSNQGESYVFETTDGGSTWTETDILDSSASGNAGSGWSISTDVDKVLVGVAYPLGGGTGFVEVYEPSSGDIPNPGGGGDPVIYDIYGHKFLGGHKALTEYLLWKNADGSQSISFITGKIRGREHGYFMHDIRITRSDCGQALLRADDVELKTHVEFPEGKECMEKLFSIGDNALVATPVIDGTFMFARAHISAGFSFLNLKFLELSDAFRNNCSGMMCDERHEDLEVDLVFE